MISGSNRTNPTTVRYYHALADVIGIFWQFHDERIRLGNIPFAATHEGGDRYKIVPFSIQRVLDQSKEKQGLYPVTDFNDSVFITMASSFQQFLEGNDIEEDQDNLLRSVQVPKPTKRFFDPFVRGKIEETTALVNDLYPISQELLQDIHEERVSEAMDQSFGERMIYGISTGTSVSTQLNLLFQDEFKPRIAVTLSKIALDHIDEARNGIGLTSESPSYTLLDNSALGLNMSRLQEWGVGDTLGCPASMKVSAEAQYFLAQKGIDVSQTTMLRDFTLKLPARVDEYIGDWFRGLTPSQREGALIVKRELSVITGEARRRALEAGTTGCPYGKEK